MDPSERRKAIKEMLKSPQAEPKKEESSTEESSPAKPAKKPYSKPELTVYGKVSDITKAVGMTGAMDGGISPTDKTRA